eukprot:TRINITY_DN3735_c1_g1_i5.p1 TRINITY_DN3735_c1_g1~~TRINITY_DN3735_c1_g1_i5.p1  ORF type:complete len:402 (-),score=0.50 TRINITY_DN3735_c1_g1_i5:444-1649(-)
MKLVLLIHCYLVLAYLSSGALMNTIDISTCCNVSSSMLEEFQHIRELSDRFLIVIGAQKAGTTFMFNLLSKHPNISQPVTHNGKPQRPGGVCLKEMHFFDQLTNVNFSNYLKSFDLSDLYHGKILIEASPSYLPLMVSPCRIKQFLPNAKFIVLLRNPAERALSHYKLWYHTVCKDDIDCQREKLQNFSNVIKHEMDIIKNKTCDILHDRWLSCFDCFEGKKSILPRGLYAKQLSEWLQYFSLEQFLIINHNETYTNLQSVADMMWEFAELDPYEVDIAEVTGFASRSRLKNFGNGKKIDDSIQRTLWQLEQFYAPHNHQLARLLQKYYKNSDCARLSEFILQQTMRVEREHFSAHQQPEHLVGHPSSHLPQKSELAPLSYSWPTASFNSPIMHCWDVARD